jgi:hypothetical protein
MFFGLKTLIENYLISVYRRFIKHTSIFILAVYGARTFSDIGLMAPPQPLQ